MWQNMIQDHWNRTFVRKKIMVEQFIDVSMEFLILLMIMLKKQDFLLDSRLAR